MGWSQKHCAEQADKIEDVRGMRTYTEYDNIKIESKLIEKKQVLNLGGWKYLDVASQMDL